MATDITPDPALALDAASLAALENTTVTVGAALPAGTNAIGKLAANSGVDIGDVDVTSLPAITGTVTVNDVLTLPGIAGNVAHDAVDSGGPVKIGGKAVTALPAAVAAGDRVDLWVNNYGVQSVASIYGAGAGADNLATAVATMQASFVGDIGVTGPASPGYLYNAGAGGWDRQRNNLDITVLASGARTTTQTGADTANYNSSGIHVVLDVTTAGSGSITLTIQAKDVISAKYYTLLVGAAVTTVSTNVYKVFPGAPVAANVSANDIIPRTFRILITANNANTITYSCGYSLVV